MHIIFVLRRRGRRFRCQHIFRLSILLMSGRTFNRNGHGLYGGGITVPTEGGGIRTPVDPLTVITHIRGRLARGNVCLLQRV